MCFVCVWLVRLVHTAFLSSLPPAASLVVWSGCGFEFLPLMPCCWWWYFVFVLLSFPLLDPFYLCSRFWLQHVLSVFTYFIILLYFFSLFFRLPFFPLIISPSTFLPSSTYFLHRLPPFLHLPLSLILTSSLCLQFFPTFFQFSFITSSSSSSLHSIFPCLPLTQSPASRTLFFFLKHFSTNSLFAHPFTPFQALTFLLWFRLPHNLLYSLLSPPNILFHLCFPPQISVSSAFLHSSTSISHFSLLHFPPNSL